MFNTLWILLSLTPYTTLAIVHHDLKEPPKSIFQDLSEGLPKFDFNKNTKSHINLPEFEKINPIYEEMKDEVAEERWKQDSNYQVESRKTFQKPAFDIPKELLLLDDIESVLNLLGLNKETKLMGNTKKIEVEEDSSEILTGELDRSNIRKFWGLDHTHLLDPEDTEDLPKPDHWHTSHTLSQKLQPMKKFKKKRLDVAQKDELTDELKDLVKLKNHQKFRTISDLLSSTNEIKPFKKKGSKKEKKRLDEEGF
ncbi:hypothetical protein DFH28DRAFT_931447 [Melampsora americana]|nr:hypothetical protein DFH28DRAFT_931447 [Melampsora americana]